jgi:hypothetical protein
MPTPVDAAPSGQPADTFDPQSEMRKYRERHNTRDLFGNPTWQDNKRAVAITRVDGQTIFGVSSKAPGHNSLDRREAFEMRWKLSRRYNDMARKNIGQIPNDALVHAETNILLRIARDRGPLAGKKIEVHVDREMCSSCDKVLPRLGLELGNPEVTFVGPRGERATMRDGRWIK